jgi:hypothetical protein
LKNAASNYRDNLPDPEAVSKASLPNFLLFDDGQY